MDVISTSCNIIKLNVGGKRYETYRSTLLSVPGTFFIGMLDCEPPQSGEFFIDRNGEKFVDVLDYLRGCTSLEKVDETEAEFYALPVKKRIYPSCISQDILECKENARKFLEENKNKIEAEIKWNYNIEKNSEKELCIVIQFPFEEKFVDYANRDTDSIYDIEQWKLDVFHNFYYDMSCTDYVDRNKFEQFKEEFFFFLHSLGFKCRSESRFKCILTW